ncbi:MAG: HNH endonuclease [Acidobacteria bacterium]|nr:HNH endonuclease [Acidobacteriota bacterium]
MTDVSNQRRCIYCRKTLSSKGASAEHVLQAALGWDQTISCVCKPCNDRLGHEIDAPLVSAMEFYRILWEVADRDGQLPKGRALGESDPWRGKKVGYNKAGLIFPSPIIPVSETEFRQFGQFDADEFERKLRERRGQGKFQLVGETVEEEILTSTSHGLEFLANQKAMRGVLKIVFNYLALKLGCEDKRLFAECIDPIRSLIAGVSSSTHDQASTLLAIAQSDMPRHRIFVATDGKREVFHGEIVLFDIIGIYVMLAESWRHGDYCFGTIIDPRSRRAEVIIGSDESIRSCLSMGRKIFQLGLESPMKLNAYKIKIFQETVQRLNAYFSANGINFNIRTEGKRIFEEQSRFGRRFPDSTHSQGRQFVVKRQQSTHNGICAVMIQAVIHKVPKTYKLGIRYLSDLELVYYLKTLMPLSGLR